MERAARIAAEVPMRCIEACVEVAESVELLAARCNLNASSDLLVAGLLAEAAARGAAENVRVNLPATGDPEWSAATQAKADELLARIHDLTKLTTDLVTSGATREPVAVG
jgi:formiminotetrahydrofolate cyclodeaminase